MHVFFVLKLYVLNWKSVKESHFFLSPGRTNPLSKNYISEVFSIGKQRFICFTNMYFSTSFSINKPYKFFCQHLGLTFPRNRSYIYTCSCIFFLYQTILQQSYIVESVLFQLFSLTFFFIAESLYFLIQLLIRLQHLSLSLVLVYVRYWIMKSI